MTDEQLLHRIQINPKVMLGKPVIAGTRLTVEYVLDRLAHGASTADLAEEYPRLAREDVLACLLFAKKTLAETDYLPLLAEGP